MTQTYASAHFNSDGTLVSGKPRNPASPCSFDAVSHAIAAATEIDEVGDRIALAAIPAGARVTHVRFSHPDVDTNGSPVAAGSLVISNGTPADDVTISALDLTAAEDLDILLPGTSPLAGGNGYLMIEMKVTTAPATAATSGTLKLVVYYDTP